ncbi:hypothetical protein CUJ86_00730 [Methanofollis fontis]|uniref:Uncharacterized protein n=1 Tax=Methanofollis fontis TaxID=2052832 RepID=A0A483CQA2_9EURY|nr:hypothetical protein CUJ86_00730 [Methanofollis fontis]
MSPSRTARSPPSTRSPLPSPSPRLPRSPRPSASPAASWMSVASGATVPPHGLTTAPTTRLLYSR